MSEERTGVHVLDGLILRALETKHKTLKVSLGQLDSIGYEIKKLKSSLAKRNKIIGELREALKSLKPMPRKSVCDDSCGDRACVDCWEAYEVLSKAESMIQEECPKGECNFIDATNKAVKGTAICLKCGTLKPLSKANSALKEK